MRDAIEAFAWSGLATIFMLIAPPTPDEDQRLALLRSLDLLDTPPEPAFDALTRLAARLLGTPVALVSLVDRDRQWFKSRVGLDASETPRALSFCAHALHADGPLVVPDALGDERFADNPLVTGEPSVRAYAGMALRSADGHALGTLCVIDHEPRAFGVDALQLLRDLADIARRELLHREAAQRARGVAKTSLQAVRDGERLYHATFDHAAMGMAVVGLDGGWLRINPALCTILGRSAQELAGMTFADVTHPDDLALDLAHVRQLLDGEADRYTLEKRYLRPDASVVWINLTVAVVRADDRPQHFVSIVEDITARHDAERALQQLRLGLEERVAERTAELRTANDQLSQAMRQRAASEAALAQSEADLRAVIEHAQDAYVCIDQAGLVVEWNRQAGVTFGWTRDEALGRRIDGLIIPPAHREAHRGGMRRLLESGQAKVLNQRIELPALCRDGRVIPCEVTLTALPSLRHGTVYAAFLHDVSQRKRVEQALADSERHLNAVVNDQTDVVFRFDAQGLLTFANEAGKRLCRLEGDGPWTRSWQSVVHPEDLPSVLAELRKLSPDHPVVITENRLVGSDGDLRWAEFVNRSFYDGQGRRLGHQTVGRDTTERKLLQQRLATQYREQQLMLDNDLVGIARLRERRVVWNNRALERIFDYGAGEMAGRPMRLLYEDDAAYRALGERAYPAIRGGRTYRTQLRMVRKDGSSVWIDLSGVELPGEAGESLWMIVDITALKAQHDRVERLAFHDALTGLPNRALLGERLSMALSQARRTKRLLAVAFVDLDGFKAVNDRHGHEAGDRLLQAVGTRLQRSVRAHDTVARLGGDEFVIVLGDLASREECRLALERMLGLIAEPVPLGDGRQARVSGSVGLAYYPEAGDSPQALLAAADAQMYAAKQAGKGRVAATRSGEPAEQHPDSSHTARSAC